MSIEPSLPDSAMVDKAVRRYVDERTRDVAYAVLSEGRVETGRVRFDATPPESPVDEELPARYEIGSITKTLTAWLLAEEVAAGRVRWHSTLADFAPPSAELSPALAAITLDALATHRSGLPRLSPRASDYLRALMLSPSDPHAGSTVAEVWSAVAAVGKPKPAADGTASYSNLGYAVLGQALAAAAGQPYEALLRERLLEPRGLDAMVLSTSGQVIPGLVEGTGDNARRAAPWHLDAYSPAGGLVASIDDMARYAQVLLDPPPALAELLAAPAELADSKGSVVGRGFVHRRVGNHHVRWHNGGTGGFYSFIGVIPEQRYALVLLGSSGRPLDPLAWQLLDPQPSTRVD